MGESIPVIPRFQSSAMRTKTTKQSDHRRRNKFCIKVSLTGASSMIGQPSFKVVALFPFQGEFLSPNHAKPPVRPATSSTSPRLEPEASGRLRKTTAGRLIFVMAGISSTARTDPRSVGTASSRRYLPAVDLWRGRRRSGYCQPRSKPTRSWSSISPMAGNNSYSTTTPASAFYLI